MNISSIVKSGKKLVLDNLPTILTGVGVAGIGLTAFLTGRASLKAEQLLKEKYGDDHSDIGFIQKVKDTYVCFLPPLGAGVATAACFIGAHKMDMAEIAKITAVATTAEKTLIENREKVEEIFGEKGLRKVDASLNESNAVHYVTATNTGDIYDTGTGKTLCCEGFWTGRLFYASPEYIHRAVNKYNELLLDVYGDNGSSLTSRLRNVQGGEPISKFLEILWPNLDVSLIPDNSRMEGYNADKTGLLEIVTDSGLIEGTDTPYLIFRPKNMPILDYDEYDERYNI